MGGCGLTGALWEGGLTGGGCGLTGAIFWEGVG